MRTRTRGPLIVSAALLLLLAAPAAAEEPQQNFHVRLGDINGTGAGGVATVTVTEAGDLHVTIHATGLLPNVPHAQHLHGGERGRFVCTDRSADADRDGYVSAEEGAPYYGPAVLSLTTTGDTGPASALALDRMPKADAKGELHYERTFPAAELPPAVKRNLRNLVVEQHGIDANGNGRYDLEALGESTFAKALGVAGVPEEATNPVTCGALSGVGPVSVPVGAVEAGDGSTAGSTDGPAPALAVLGGAMLAGAVLARRRVRHRNG
ncbi:MAG TPA: hypothetical protein VIL00_09710 [Pseudonocardiaceae bacterium]